MSHLIDDIDVMFDAIQKLKEKDQPKKKLAVPCSLCSGFGHLLSSETISRYKTCPECLGTGYKKS